MAESLPSFLQFNRRRRAAPSGTAVEPEKTVANPAAVPAPVLPRPAVVDASAVEAAPAEASAYTAPGTEAGPTVSGAERRTLGPAPLPTNARSETVGRPVYDDTGDRLTDLANYDRALGEQRNPKDLDGWWGTLKEAGKGFLQGGLFGAAARGLRDIGSHHNLGERAERDRERARVAGEVQAEQGRQGWAAKLADAQADIDLKNANAEYSRKRPDIEADKAGERAKDQRARALVSIYNRLPEFDPSAPENADLAAQMRDAGLPVVTKRANQQLSFQQDPRSGAWTVIAGDKQSGTATAGAVTGGDGKQLVTSSAAQMRAEIAANNLKFHKEESEANRKLRQEEFAGRMKLGWANYSQRIEEAKQRAAQAAEADRARGVNTAVSYAKAKAQADAKGFDLPDYIDILTTAGIKVEK